MADRSGFSLKSTSKYQLSNCNVQKRKRIQCRFEMKHKGCLNPNCVYLHQRDRKKHAYAPYAAVSHTKADDTEGKENSPEENERKKLEKIYKESASIYKSVYERPVFNASCKTNGLSKKPDYADTLEKHLDTLRKLKEKIETLEKKKKPSKEINKKLNTENKKEMYSPLVLACKSNNQPANKPKEEMNDELYNFYEDELDFEPNS